MRAWKIGLLGAAAAFAMSGAAWAQDTAVKEPAEPAAPEAMVQEDEAAGGVDVSFNVGVATDYVFRGISQTDENAQVFGGVDLTMDMLYAGVWASNVDFNEGTDAEVDFYVGVKPEAGGWTFDLAGIYYAYINQPDDAPEYNYFEAKAAASRAFGPATIGGAVYYSPEFFAEVGDALYYEVNGGYTINDRITATAALGRQEFGDLDDADYTTWNIGATFALTDNFGIDVRYHDTDADDFGDLYEERVVASLKAAF